MTCDLLGWLRAHQLVGFMHRDVRLGNVQLSTPNLRVLRNHGLGVSAPREDFTRGEHALHERYRSGREAVLPRGLRVVGGLGW